MRHRQRDATSTASRLSNYLATENQPSIGEIPSMVGGRLVTQRTQAGTAPGEHWDGRRSLETHGDRAASKYAGHGPWTKVPY